MAGVTLCRCTFGSNLHPDQARLVRRAPLCPDGPRATSLLFCSGNTLVETVPRTRWKVGHARTKGYMFQNQPVAAGLGEEIMPIQACAVLADKALAGGQRSLRDAFDNWVSRRAV
jgi:hypothetical protein